MMNEQKAENVLVVILRVASLLVGCACLGFGVARLTGDTAAAALIGAAAFFISLAVDD